MRKPAVFFDRDGILNSLVFDEVRGVMDSPLSADRLELFRDAPAFVQALNKRGYLVLVVTDQPFIARGRLSPIGLDRIHRKLRESLIGARIDGIFFCPHDPDAHAAPGSRVREEFATACRCRKPAPGLILRAAQSHSVDLARSFMVCRNLEDVKAGRSAALETILLADARMDEIEAPPDLRPHHAVANFADVVRIIDAARNAALRS